MLLPSVPTPAPKDNSPVGFSSTLISITLVFSSKPSFISALTSLNIPRALKLFIDLA